MNIYLKILLWILGILGVLVLSLIALIAYQKKANKITPATNGLSMENSNVSDSIFLYLKAHMRNNAYVSIALIESDSVNFVGIKRDNDRLVNIDLKDSIFQIGSISKIFTTSILSQMVVDGDIKLEESIDNYLGYKLNKNIKITFESLANHSSGLDRMPKGVLKNMLLDPENPYSKYDLKWLDHFLQKEITINDNKKGKSEYSNLGISILGHTLAKSKNTSYEALCEQYIFSKYKMDNTFINDESTNPKIIESYQINNEISKIWVLNCFAPAGGIASDINDMIKFTKSQFSTENEAINLAQKATINVNEEKSFGLGWVINHNKTGNDLLWHNGATQGYTSSLIIDKSNKKAVIVLSTIDHSDSANQLDKLAKALLSFFNNH